MGCNPNFPSYKFIRKFVLVGNITPFILITDRGGPPGSWWLLLSSFSSSSNGTIPFESRISDSLLTTKDWWGGHWCSIFLDLKGCQVSYILRPMDFWKIGFRTREKAAKTYSKRKIFQVLCFRARVERFLLTHQFRTETSHIVIQQKEKNLDIWENGSYLVALPNYHLGMA